jgi:hypothetical protein
MKLNISTVQTQQTTEVAGKHLTATNISVSLLIYFKLSLAHTTISLSIFLKHIWNILRNKKGSCKCNLIIISNIWTVPFSDGISNSSQFVSELTYEIIVKLLNCQFIPVNNLTVYFSKIEIYIILQYIARFPVYKTEILTAVGIRCADHATLSIRKSWH